MIDLLILRSRDLLIVDRVDLMSSIPIDPDEPGADSTLSIRQIRRSQIIRSTVQQITSSITSSRAHELTKSRIFLSSSPYPLITEGKVSIVPSVNEISMSKPSDLVQGTLDLLILKILALEPLHGWAISQRLKQMSDEVLQVSDGSLYPALHKLEQQGWIEAEWKPSENNRRAKFYSLTRSGRRHLNREAESWTRLSLAISLVVKMPET